MSAMELVWGFHLAVYQRSMVMNERLASMIPKRLRRNMFSPNKRLELYQKRFKDRQALTAKDGEHSEWYQYEPLQPRQIRLLHIHPGSPTESISCSLTIHSLDDDDNSEGSLALPSFEALSYTWGDPTEEYRISCDGRSLQVTRNLLTALQHLRPAAPSDATGEEVPPRTVWIDAVCINQGDLAERGAQVQVMDAIYRRAESVVVWLGEPTRDSAAAFSLMRRVHVLAESKPPTAAGAAPLATVAELAALGAGHDIPPPDSPDWIALDAVYWRAWFTRVWIIQEIAVSRAATVHCGGDSTSWDDFAATADFIHRRGIDALTGVSTALVLVLSEARTAYRLGSPVALISLLTLFRSSLATNPVDKVYALLNLAPRPGDNSSVNGGGNNDILIRPEYGRPVAHVFRDVGKAFLRQSLDILSHVGDPIWKAVEDNESNGRLPSWAPDWSCVPREYSLIFSPQASRWRAGGEASSPPSIRFSPSSPGGDGDDGSGDTLFIQGRRLDRIKDIGEAFMIASRSRLKQSYGGQQRSRLAQGEIQGFLDFSRQRRWRMWERLVTKLGTYPTGEDLRSVLQRTMIADKDLSGGGNDNSGSSNEGSNSGEAAVSSGSRPTLETIYQAFCRAEAVEKPPKKSGKQPTKQEGEAPGPEAGEKELDWQTESEYANRYGTAVMAASYGRKIFTTQGGYVGLAPYSALPGDQVVLFAGGKTPYVLRRSSKKGAPETFSFLGEAYVHGFMHGEGWVDRYPVEEFAIV